jgi:hypothetical protein
LPSSCVRRLARDEPYFLLFVRLARISRNSIGPLMRCRLRLARSWPCPSFAPNLSISREASSAALFWLSSAVGRAVAEVSCPTKRQIASARPGESVCSWRQSSRALSAAEDMRTVIVYQKAFLCHRPFLKCIMWRFVTAVGIRTHSALDVMSDARGRGTPAMLAFLAGVVHRCQRTVNHHDGKRDQCSGFHLFSSRHPVLRAFRGRGRFERRPTPPCHRRPSEATCFLVQSREHQSSHQG